MKQILLTIFICFYLIQFGTAQSFSSQISRKGGSEIGVSFGNLWINGDIKSKQVFGQSYSLHWRKGINDVWSYKVALNHGSSFGVSFMPNENFENAYPDIFQGYNKDNPLFLAYKTNYSSLDFVNIFELTNLAPDVYLKKWNFYLGIGFGVANFSTKLNLKNEQDLLYTDLIERTNFNQINDINTVEGRRNVLNLLGNIYDDSYETPGPKKQGKFRLGDETNIQAHLLFSIGASRKLSPRVNIGLEYNVRISDNDLLDGYDKRIDEKSSGNDFINSAQIVVACNMSKSVDKRPLFWNNSWSNLDELLSEQEMKNDSLWLDDDNDGVFNNQDQQANSMSDCPVDQFGVTLDSDKDGIPDCIDPYPFISQNDLDKIIEERLAQHDFKTESKKDVIQERNIESFDQELVNKQILISQLNKPIYFDLNKNELSQDSKKHLLEISKALLRYNDVKLQVKGYASIDGQTSENYTLSKERAVNTKEFLVETLYVKSDRITVEQFGEENPVVKTDSESNSFLNRRVELLLYIEK